MQAMLGYLEFLSLFVVPPVVVLAVVTQLRAETDGVAVLAVLPFVAVVYTVPWDSFMIARGVWRYGSGAVTGWTFGIPLGELLFIVLQTALVVLWVGQFPLSGFEETETLSARTTAIGVGVGGTVGLVGLLLLFGHQQTYYLGTLLLWAAPVLAVQWGLGARQLWRRRRFLAVGVAVPTLYLATIDRVALSFDVWQLSDRLTSGVTIVGLPVEEGAFFLLTSAFVAKGVVLYQHGRERLYRRFVETE